MNDFHCDMLELSLRVATDEINQDALIQALGIEENERKEFIDEDGDFSAGVNIGGRDETTDYHVHLRVLLVKEGKSRISFSYHNTKLKLDGDEPPHAEEVAQWIAGFLKSDKVTAHVHSAYKFDETFAPVIALPFPFATSDKKLAGSLITGVSILIRSKELPAQLAIIQDAEVGTVLALSTEHEISLKEFTLSSELEKLSLAVSSLIKRKEVADDNRKNSE